MGLSCPRSPRSSVWRRARGAVSRGAPRGGVRGDVRSCDRCAKKTRRARRCAGRSGRPWPHDPDRRAGDHDLLDACAVAWSARRLARGEAHCRSPGHRARPPAGDLVLGPRQAPSLAARSRYRSRKRSIQLASCSSTHARERVDHTIERPIGERVVGRREERAVLLHDSSDAELAGMADQDRPTACAVLRSRVTAQRLDEQVVAPELVPLGPGHRRPRLWTPERAVTLGEALVGLLLVLTRRERLGQLRLDAEERRLVPSSRVYPTNASNEVRSPRYSSAGAGRIRCAPR